MTAPDPRQRLARSPVVRAYDRGEDTTLIARSGDVLRFSGDAATLVRTILDALVTPRSGEALLAHLSELAGAEVAWTGTISETVARLESAGAIERVAPHVATSPRGLHHAPPRRVLLGLAGGVAAAFAPALVQVLQARGHQVRVAATRNALRFVAPLALEALTHAPVVASLWPTDPSSPVPHLELARWADVMLVWPATATSIARLSAGTCTTVVSAAAIATRAPVLVVPAMNEAMYVAPAVQRNLDQLRADGFLVAHPATGLEVADVPEQRRPAIGAAPPVSAVADLIDAALAHEPEGRARAAAVDWDAIYDSARDEELPWFTPELDAEIAATLESLAHHGRRMLDLGTGLGVAATTAADRGFSVVATDVSPHAIARASRRAGDRSTGSIVWLVDDVRKSALRGSFDLVLDRGLLHVLDEADHRSYAATVARLTRAGGHLVLECHSSAEPTHQGARRFAVSELVALLGDAFELVSARETVLAGPAGRAPKAILAVFTRRGVAR